MGCGSIRVSVQAIANTLCFAATATILTYTLVRAAMAASSSRYRKIVIAGVTIFLVVWFTAGCTVCLAFCRTLYPRSMERRRRLIGRGHDVIRLLLPQSDVQRGQGHGMEVLPREPPVLGGVTVANSVIIPAYEQPEGEPSDGAPECAVCREEVEQGEMVRRVPACLHLFHQRCIDRRLRERSTCPVCRTDAVAPLLEHMV